MPEAIFEPLHAQPTLLVAGAGAYISIRNPEFFTISQIFYEVAGYYRLSVLMVLCEN